MAVSIALNTTSHSITEEIKPNSFSCTCSRYHYTQGTRLSLPDSALKREVLLSNLSQLNEAHDTASLARLGDGVYPLVPDTGDAGCKC